MSFADLGLKPELLRAVDEKGYSEPTPIQAKAIPAVLGGGDVLAGAQTGTGKTAAFVLPILQRLGQAAGRAPRALVLTPTRELAAQVAESAQVYGKYVGLRTVVVFGGVSINPQIDALEDGCDLLVATPGRLLDLAEQGVLDLHSVQCFVLDEADRMLDMGFIHAIRRILKLLPQQRQNLLFSATYSDDIRELAARILRNPTNIEVAARNATADRVDQQIYRVQKDHKRHLLAHLIDDGNWHQVLVFTRTKHGANRLAQQLESNGILAAAIHGNKSQGARVRALSDFKANKITALVATEVAARGLDIKELPHVVNYELPNVPEDYVHRIGRTARAGGTGSAVSLVSPDEAPLLKDIERLLRRTLPVAALPQFPIVVTHGKGGRHSPSRDEELESGVEFAASGNKSGEGRGRRFGQRGGATERGAGQSGERQRQHFGQRGESRGEVSGRQFDRRDDQRGPAAEQTAGGEQQFGRDGGRQQFGPRGRDRRDGGPRQFDRRGDQQQRGHRGYRGDAPRGGGQRDGGWHRGEAGEQRGDARQYGQASEQRGDARHPGQAGQQRGGDQRGEVRHHNRPGDQRGGGRPFGRHSDQRGRPGRPATGEGGHGRSDSRRGRPAQPSRGFSAGSRDQRRREGGGPGGRR